MFSNSEFLNNSKFFSLLGSMCNAACIDETIHLVLFKMCIFSEFVDISEMLSSCLSWSFMFWTTFRVYSRFPEACWTEKHSEFVLLSSQVHIWESSLTGFWGLLELSCLTDTHCRETRQHAFAYTVGDPGEELSRDLFDISDGFSERKWWLLEKWL